MKAKRTLTEAAPDMLAALEAYGNMERLVAHARAWGLSGWPIDEPLSDSIIWEDFILPAAIERATGLK